MFRNISLLSWILLLILISACAPTRPPAIPDNNKVATGVAVGLATGVVVGAMSTGVSVPVAAAMGGIIGGAIGTALSEDEPLLFELDRDHVQLIRVGEDIMLVLSSDYYFYPNSTHLNENFFPALDRIADYLRLFETTTIKIAGYTDAIGDELRNVALSRQQAQNIAKYLWARGLDARMMYTIGYGCQFPIANNATYEGRAANRRVQITFRYVPIDTA